METDRKDAKKKRQEFKIRDFIRLLQLLEKLYQKPLGTNQELISFIRELRAFLSPYKELEKDEFFKLLEKSLPSHKLKKVKKKGILKNIDVENISFDELRTLLAEKRLTKEELLWIGEKRFGISRGAHMKLRRDELLELIERAMDDIEKLNTIRHKASE